MKEFMLARGWVISKECHCGGIHKIEYVHIDQQGLTIKTLPGKKTWRAIKKGRNIGSGIESNIETYINGLVQVTV